MNLIKKLVMLLVLSFKSSKFPALLQYVDEYGKLIKESQRRDVERWDRGSKNFDLEVKKMKSWLQGRANYMDSFVADL